MGRTFSACSKGQKIKQEGMTFDHDFCYFILLFSSLLKKEGREKENDVAKIVMKSHTFQFHQAKNQLQNFEKNLKQKSCAIRRFNVPNFCYFSKKFRLTWSIKNVNKLLKNQNHRTYALKLFAFFRSIEKNKLFHNEPKKIAVKVHKYYF